MGDTPIQRVLGALLAHGGGKKSAGGWQARCPAHDDSSPSLSISVRDDGAVLLKCHAGCEQRAVVTALGLAWSDLFVPKTQPSKLGPVVATYDYVDEAEVLLFQVTRHEPKTFRQRRPDPGQPGRFIHDAKGVRQVLYRLPQVVAAVARGETVFVVEGEKDVQALESLGLVATCNAGGAGKWKPSHTESLRGAPRVVIVPDCDEPGSRHASTVATALKAVVGEVRVLELPGTGKDAHDWVAAGGTADWLDSLCADAPLAAEWLSRQRPVAELQGELRPVADPAPTDPWTPPVPLEQAKLPPFPTDALPWWQRDYVKALAIETQTPEDLGGMLSLAATALAVSRKVQIRLPWSEPLCLFVAAALPPASRKTAVYTAITAPLRNFERIEAMRGKEAAAKATALHEAAKKQLKGLEKRLANADDAELECLAQEVAEKALQIDQLAPPPAYRLLTDDCTIEKLNSLLAEQDGRMGVFTDEGGGPFDLLAGRYSKNGAPNFGPYLAGHNAGTIKVDRVGRPPEHIPRATLTVGLALQPSVLRQVAQVPGANGRGFLARFLYALPASKVGFQELRPEPSPDHVVQTYGDKMHALLKMAPGIGHGEDSEHRMYLDAPADEAFLAFRGWLEEQLRPGGKLSAADSIQEWAGKLAGHVGRIAGLLHLADRADHGDPWDAPVTGEAMTRAISIGHYLVEHALEAFNIMGGDESLDAAKTLLRWISREDVREFGVRDVMRGLSSRFQRAEQVHLAVLVLGERGYLRRAPAIRTSAGRPPVRYLVNPSVFCPDLSSETHDRSEPTKGSECNEKSA